MSAPSTKYNGWTNYETWNVKLWLDNNQGDQKHMLELASDDTLTTYEVAQRIKAEIEEAAEMWMSDQASMFADLLNSALSEVNWYEIAQSYIDDALENAETE